MRLISLFILVLFMFFSITYTSAQYFSFPHENPVELGKVKWLRDYDLAIHEAKIKKLPVFILFQEVPGCSNCTTYGNNILSNPLIVETIESCFVPLCIYNNTDGKDRKVLNKYNEPIWNNPVIRITDKDGNNIVPRQPEFSKMSNILSTMIDGLGKSGQSVPKYLQLLYNEESAKEEGLIAEAYFSMYCFWSGEKEIAGIPGVLATEAGFMHGKEVVSIRYRSDKISLDDLYAQSKKLGCGDDVYGGIQAGAHLKIKPLGIYRKDKEDKYYLYNSEYKVIPMTNLQKTKVNRMLALGQKPDSLLSPKQLSILRSKSKSVSHISDRMEDVWWSGTVQ